MSPSMFLAAVAIAGFTGVAQAKKPSLFALPATGWAGIDGNWSTVEFALGSDAQPVNVVLATALSEFWAVGMGGCYPREPHCSNARGGLYNPKDSKDWDSMGTWGLGLEHLGYGGVGQYGLDSLQSHSNIQHDAKFSMDGALISVINTTDYFLGQFGVGVTQGNFGKSVEKSPLTKAVEKYGLIHSYSYGYTAGASYRDMPASVTLGGFDTSRFVDHGEDFTITKEDTLLRTLVRGIQVSANGSQKAPEDWDSDILELSSWDKAFTALIDTSTPFMWLPDNVCEEFASALGLDYRDDLELYTISNDRYRDYRHTDSYTFTFSLSSTDNNDDLGDPLGTKGVVNITMPIQTFVSTVEYPFHDEAISYGAAAIPYFSLRKSGDNSTFVIGRSFLQETYLVTQYDKGTFSLHQALFPDDPERDANLVAIEQPSDSPYPAPPPPPKDGLSKGQIVGIVIGGSAAVLLCIIGWWYFRRRKAAKAEGVPGVVSESELDKASDASLKPRVSVKGSPLGRIITKIVGPKRSAVRSENRQREEQTQPFEAPNHHEIYEMPAPPPPVELNGDTSDEIDDVEAANAMMGLGGQYMSTYEQARLRIDRQLAGPVPEYSPPADGVAPPLEKAAYNYEQPRAIPAVDIQPVSPPATDSNFSNNSNSLQGSMGSVVSPVSATGNGTMRWDEPSPVAMIPPQLPSLGFSSQRRSDPSLDVSSQLPLDGSTSQSGDPHPPSSPVQRRAIDPSNVVCLGPLPENVQLPDHMALPQIMGPDGTRISPPSGSESRDPYEDTLGSNYTEEESRLEELATQASQYGQYQQYQHQQGTRWPLQTQDLQRGQYSSNRSHDPDTPESFERIDGMEFIHVPQPAEKRYSWEEDR